METLKDLPKALKALGAAFLDATFGAKQLARQDRIDLVRKIYGASGLPEKKAAAFVDTVQDRICSTRLLNNIERAWRPLLQSITCGRFRIYEYLQLLNEAPELLVAIAEGMGLTDLDQLQRLVADRKVSATQMIDAMIRSNTTPDSHNHSD